MCDVMVYFIIVRNNQILLEICVYRKGSFRWWNNCLARPKLVIFIYIYI